MNIQIKKISKTYEQQAVLKDFSLEIEEGSTTCIMGKSGVGKTTLLNILMGLEQIDTGVIKGLDDKKISAVFQENRLLEHASALKNIQFVTNKQEDDIVDVLSEVGIDGKLKIPVSEYSGGMKRRVAIIRALLAESDVLLMDEPLKGLDEETKRQVVNVIKKYTIGKTLVIVTHDINECHMFESKVINLDECV